MDNQEPVVAAAAAAVAHHIKSILKPRSKPSTTTNALKVKTSNASSGVGSQASAKQAAPTGKSGNDAKKKVEITTPSHSITSIKQQQHGQNPARNSFIRDTPLPRVALLPPRPGHLSKLLPKPKTFIAHKESSLKKKSGSSPSPASRPPQPLPPPQAIPRTRVQNPVKISASTSKIKTKPVLSMTSQVKVGGGGLKTSPSPKRSKSEKKLKKKKKSKSTSDVRSSSSENGGKEYIKELVTINELLKSVTDPSNQDTPGQTLIEGFVRPFSALELKSLLTSVGKVASIHKDPANLAPTPPKKEEEDEEEEVKKPKIPAGELTEEEALAAAIAETPPSSKKKKKKRKNKKSPKANKSKSSTSTAATNNKNAKDNKAEPKPVPAKGSASKNLASKKTLKSNVKTLKVKSKPKKDNEKQSSKEELESELSELDLVKSAILNKRYYEESLALQTAQDTDAKTTKNLKNSGQRHTANNATTGGGAVIMHGRQLPLPPSKPTDRDQAMYNKALGNVLVNYSHVIRPSTRRSAGLEQDLFLGGTKNLEATPTSGGVGNTKVLKNPKFEKELQNIKYGGPVERGMLDIDHIKVSDEPPQQGKYTHLSAKSASKFTSTDIGHSGTAEIIIPRSILVKETPSSEGVSSEKESSSKSRRRRSRKSRSKSRSRSPKETNKVPPLTAPPPVVGFRGPFASPNPEKKAHHNSTRSDRASPLTRSPNNQNQNARNFHLEPPIVNLIKPRPENRWNEKSIANSLFDGLVQDPSGGGGTTVSRWGILNDRILERNRELKNQDNNKKKKLVDMTHRPPPGRGPLHPHQDGDEGSRGRRSSQQRDRMEEKRILLNNLDRARKAFDDFGVHENVMAKKFGKDQHVKVDEAFGHLDTKNRT